MKPSDPGDECYKPALSGTLASRKWSCLQAHIVIHVYWDYEEWSVLRRYYKEAYRGRFFLTDPLKDTQLVSPILSLVLQMLVSPTLPNISLSNRERYPKKQKEAILYCQKISYKGTPNTHQQDAKKQWKLPTLKSMCVGNTNNTKIGSTKMAGIWTISYVPESITLITYDNRSCQLLIFCIECFKKLRT